MKKIPFILTLIFFSVLNAADLSLDTILQNMTKQRDQIQTYKADIINTVDGSFVTGKNIQHGKIFYQAPDLIRSENYEPELQITLTKSGQSFLIDQKGNINELKKENTDLTEDFKDPLNLFNKFDFTIQAIDKKTLKLIGVPKSNTGQEVFSKNIFSKVVFYLDTNNFVSKEIKVFNKKDQEIINIVTEHKIINNILFPFKTTIKISTNKSKINITTLYENIVLNQQISADTFDLDNIVKYLKSGAIK